MKAPKKPAKPLIRKDRFVAGKDDVSYIPPGAWKSSAPAGHPAPKEKKK